MELIIDVLVLFIVLNCVFKLSLWPLWQQLLYSLLLGAFAWWSVRYAVLQSKTQIADFLQDTSAMQTVAILVTIESAVGIAFCLHWLNLSTETTKATGRLGNEATNSKLSLIPASEPEPPHSGLRAGTSTLNF